MPLPNPFRYFAFGDLFNTVLPDFVLAFAFFTAIIYAVLSRRFGQQRPRFRRHYAGFCFLDAATPGMGTDSHRSAASNLMTQYLAPSRSVNLLTS